MDWSNEEWTAMASSTCALMKSIPDSIVGSFWNGGQKEKHTTRHERRLILDVR
jgi:hypothetical protein